MSLMYFELVIQMIKLDWLTAENGRKPGHRENSSHATGPLHR